MNKISAALYVRERLLQNVKQSPSSFHWQYRRTEGNNWSHQHAFSRNAFGQSSKVGGEKEQTLMWPPLVSQKRRKQN